MALAELGRHEEALAALSQALQATGESPVVLVAIADLEVRRSRFAVAAGYYKRALEAGSEHDYVRGHHLHIKMLMCDWSGFNEEVAALRASVLAGELATHPMTLLSLVDEPDLHRRCAERFAPPARTIRWGAKAKSDKIKIAYVSSDFFDHPVAHLMAGIIEAHDRSAFDVFAVSLGRRQDQWTQRIRESTRFFDASAASDREAVAFARDHGIDIAVDLNGYTENARPQLFASRLAPVQMSYLGYLGTVAGSFMDYLIADQVLAPEASRGFCTEKMAYLPEYHWNWDSWLDPSAAGRRADHGLPESGFVFCSFNNSYKITPDVFESWMRILKSTSDAVLWLYASNDEARRNLEREAAKWIVGKERLVFAEKVALRDHISRQRLADIMLDTFPYGGGATSSNALRVGLPVLTLAGRSISSRMGASLLSSAGLEGLVAHSLAEYEQRAIYLAERPAEVAALRRQLIGRRRSEARTFAAHLERIYSAAFKRASSGAPPEDILARP
jgi:predicted O-linked N-acetylglucosamine transferase (SPINDLY family)